MTVQIKNVCNNSTDLGGYSFAVFEYNENVNVDDIIFKYLAEIYRYRTADEYDQKSNSFLHNLFGPLTINNLKVDDFCFLKLSEVCSKINQFIDDPDWGEDLETFKSNWKEVYKIVVKENFVDCKFYFINISEMEKEIYINSHPDIEWFIYFIGMFAIDRERKRFIVLDLAFD